MQPDVIGGRYRVGSAIGQGGMGTVWLCRDELLHRDVAVKQVGLLPGESVTDSARALREARSSAALSHHNVVTVFDVVEEDGAIWLVMEHVPSRSLAQIIKEDGPLEPARVAAIGAQVADGLAAAHSGGTMHRDVKPGNVLVRDDGAAKISDFGIARSAGDPALTGSGMLTGTPGYFSPELARGAAPSPAADVWALGATLYAAVEGRPPYRLQTNPVAVLDDIASHQPSAPRRAGFLEPALVRMMDRDPGSRWSMADAAHALHRLADEHSPDRTRAVTLGSARQAEPGDRPRRDAPSPPRPVPDRVESGGAAREAAPPQHPRRERARQGDGDDTRDGSRGRRGVLAAVIGIALLVVAAGVGYTLAHDNGSGTANGPTASSSTRSTGSSAGPSTGGGTPSSRSSASTSASTSTSPSPSTSASTSTSPSPPAQAGTAAKAAFLRDYFQKVPGGTDAAWAELTATYQHKIGRSSFDGFWRTIRSVGVSNVKPAGGDAVEATLTYHAKDGGTSTERHRLVLVRSGGGFLIADDARS